MRTPNASGYRAERGPAEARGSTLVTNAERYVTAAYLVALGIVLLSIVLYAFRLARLQREMVALPPTPSEHAENEDERERAL